MSDFKLAVAVPSTGVIKTKTVESLVKLFKAYPDAIFLSHEGSIIHHMRERLVKKAIDLDCTHLLFVDSDMVFEPKDLQELIDKDTDIVGADYNRRKLPLESSRAGDSVATGFMLIKLSIFYFLPEPWFFWESNQEGDLVTGEDFWFCRLAKSKGFKVECVGKVGHLGEYRY